MRIVACLCCLTVLLMTLFEGRASAALRQVCFAVVNIDSAGGRTNCPTSTNGTAPPGATRPCRADTFAVNGGPQDYDYMVGFDFELWDADPGSGNDDYIDRWTTTNALGFNCVRFDWESHPNYEGETNGPDVYVRLTPYVRSTGIFGGSPGAAWVVATDPFYVEYNAIIWRDFQAVNMQPGVTYNIDGRPTEAGIQPIRAFTSSTSNISKAWRALDSAQRTMQLLDTSADGFGGSSQIIMRMFDGSCGGGTNLACSYGRGLITIRDEGMTDGQVPTHELGHTFHKHQFEQDYLNGTVDGVNYGGGACNPAAWQPNGENDEGCATTEGFAMFVAAASWWNVGASSSRPFYNTYQIEEPIVTWSNCDYNAKIPLQVARAFWDLADANNETSQAPCFGAHDAASEGAFTVARLLNPLPDCNSDGCDRETGANAKNLYDIVQASPGWFNVDRFATFIKHNWLTSQDQN